MTEVNAWLLNVDAGVPAAVGELEMVHLLPDAPTLYEIPRSPGHCRKVLVWQDAVLPLLDLNARLSLAGTAVTAEGQGVHAQIALCAYRAAPGAAQQLGALLLRDIPHRIRVRDADARELPEALLAWRPYAISCFEHATLGPIPVLDLYRVFSPAADGRPWTLSAPCRNGLAHPG
jgi:chemotaxis signal transduction protein